MADLAITLVTTGKLLLSSGHNTICLAFSVREYSKAVKLASLLADGEEGLYLVIIYTYQHTGIDTSFGH
jgi:hypothetical protein